MDKNLKMGPKADEKFEKRDLERTKSQPRFQDILIKNTLVQGLDFWVEFCNCFARELFFIASFALFSPYSVVTY